ncbi:MAG: hypothetical protein ABI556_10080 [Gemmatimonadales bacterium]
MIVFAGLVSLACFSDDIVGSSTVTGNYTLRTINGSQLPYTITGSGTNKTEIVSDVMTLFQGFTYSESTVSRITLNAQAADETKVRTGAYSLLGTSFILSSNDGSLERRGTISGNTMTITEAGKVSVLSK